MLCVSCVSAVGAAPAEGAPNVSGTPDGTAPRAPKLPTPKSCTCGN